MTDSLPPFLCFNPLIEAKNSTSSFTKAVSNRLLWSKLLLKCFYYPRILCFVASLSLINDVCDMQDFMTCLQQQTNRVTISSASLLPTTCLISECPLLRRCLVHQMDSIFRCCTKANLSHLHCSSEKTNPASTCPSVRKKEGNRLLA